MPICIINESNFCERHQTKHTGRLLELALMDNELGESYRLLWDRQLRGEVTTTSPSIIQKAANYAKAQFDHTVSGRKEISKEEYDGRITICNQCDKLNQAGECSLCGCPVEKKAKWAEQSCPLDKWPRIPLKTIGGCGCG